MRSPDTRWFNTVLCGTLAALAVVAALVLITALGAQPDVAQADLAPPGVAVPSVVGYVRFAGIEGESVESHHIGWCDLLAFNQSLFSDAVQAGRAAANPVFEDIVLVKHLDSASPSLQKACAEGTVLADIKIDILRIAGGNTVPYYSIVLRDARVTSYNLGNTGGSELTPQGLPRVDAGANALAGELPIEELSVAFGRITTEYTPLKSDGSAGAAIKFEWDLATNRTR